MRCDQCGHQNWQSSRLCVRCGAPLRQQTAETQENPAATDVQSSCGGGAASLTPVQRRCDRSEKAVSDTALLELAGTSSGDCVFVLEKDVTTVGRHPDSDLFLDDLTVSRMHAEFRREPAGFSVNDVGSLNGTYVNNRAVVGSAPLECGDRVQIGKFTLIHRKSHASKAFPSTPCKACVGDASGV